MKEANYEYNTYPEDHWKPISEMPDDGKLYWVGAVGIGVAMAFRYPDTEDKPVHESLEMDWDLFGFEGEEHLLTHYTELLYPTTPRKEQDHE